MEYETLSNLVLQYKDFEDGKQVATLVSEDYVTDLYADKDKGLVFTEEGKEYAFMEMMSEADFDRVSKAIEEFKQSEDDAKVIKFDFLIWLINTEVSHNRISEAVNPLLPT